MAVPKKKRSKVIIKFRRTYKNIISLKKYQINTTFYSNFVNLKNSFDNSKVCDFNNKNCGYYYGSLSNKVCLDCYLKNFNKAYVKGIY